MEELEVCEPCDFFFKTHRKATRHLGWDLAPVCDWHATQPWVTPPRCGTPIKVKVVTEQICRNDSPCPDHDL